MMCKGSVLPRPVWKGISLIVLVCIIRKGAETVRRDGGEEMGGERWERRDGRGEMGEEMGEER
jgi:hypothetical protein